MATGTVEAKPGAVGNNVGNSADNRVGIYGGAFDPVHRAHIALAQAALVQFELREVVFIPSGNPPHRTLTGASVQDRWAMLDLAVSDHAGFVCDDWELQQSSVTYTYETLQHFCQTKNTEYFFLMGEDSLLDFTSWYKWSAILQLCHLAVAKRPGLEVQDLPAELSGRVVDFKSDKNTRSGNIYFIESEELAISATSIRESVSVGAEDWRAQVHPSVAQYIQDNRLYQNV